VAGSVQPIVWVGSTIATLNSATNTMINFTYPALRQGHYTVRIYVDGIGYASPDFILSTYTSVNSLIDASGSIVGNVLVISGNALVSTDDYSFSLQILKSNDPNSP
jgi:hypothetical protein